MNHLKYFKLGRKSILIFLQIFPTFLNKRLQADASFGIARVWTDGEAGGDGGGGGEDNIDIIHQIVVPNVVFVFVVLVVVVEGEVRRT